MRPHHGAIILVILCLKAGSGLAGGLRDAQDSWLLDALETARMLRDEIPGEIPRAAGGWSLEALQGHLFGLAELPQQGLRWRWVGRGRGAPSLVLSRQQTGTDLFRTTALEGMLAWGQERGLGIVYRTRQADSVAGGWPSWRRISARVHGMRALGTGRLRWRLFLPLGGVPRGAIPEGREGFFQTSMLWRSWALVWRVERAPGGRPCSGWSLDLKLGQGAGVGFRADGPSGTCGLSLVLLRGPFLLRTSHLAHPRLGVMHRFSVGVVRP